MNRNFRLEFRRSAGNIHIRLWGEFSGTCAWELIKTIRRRQAGPGRVFVDTSGVGRVTAEGALLFKTHMARSGERPEWLFFKGTAGVRIAPDGSRVIIRPMTVKRCGFPIKAIEQ